MQPTTVYKKDRVVIEERLDDSLHIRLKNKYLHYRTLPARPKKVSSMVNVPLPALTTQPATWKPPAHHPWRQRMLAETSHALVQKVALTKMPM